MGRSRPVRAALQGSARRQEPAERGHPARGPGAAHDRPRRRARLPAEPVVAEVPLGIPTLHVPARRHHARRIRGGVPGHARNRRGRGQPDCSPWPGWRPIDWLNNEWWARVALIAAITWRWTGYNMVIILAGLQSIPAELYEAARIDGAGRWQIFTKVVIPQLRPVLIFTTVTSTIGALQLFDENFILTEGGPNDATLTPVLYLYKVGFRQFDFGYASAIAWLLVVTHRDHRDRAVPTHEGEDSDCDPHSDVRQSRDVRCSSTETRGSRAGAASRHPAFAGLSAARRSRACSRCSRSRGWSSRRPTRRPTCSARRCRCCRAANSGRTWRGCRSR